VSSQVGVANTGWLGKYTDFKFQLISCHLSENVQEQCRDIFYHGTLIGSPVWSFYTQPFYGSVEFVRDNPGEPVPEETFTHYTHRGHQSSLSGYAS